MATLTLDQQRAIALARARQRAASSVPLEQSRQMPPGMRSDPAGTAEMNQMARQGIAQSYIDETPFGHRAVKFAQGLPFVGQYFDEAMGALGGDDAQGRARAMQENMDIARPKESMALQLAGGVAGSIPMALAAAPAVLARAGATIPAQIARGAGAGAAAGTTEGAVSGFGAGNDDDRLASAGAGAALGGVAGTALGAAAPLGASAVRNLVSYVKGTDVAGIATTFGISKPAAKAVREALASEDTAAAIARINRAGPNAMLVEGGPSLQAMADAVANSGGAATRIMREATDQRVAQGVADVHGAIDDAFRPGTSVIPRPPKLGTLYDTAYSKPIDYSKEVGQRIEGLMRFVPKEVVAKARKLIEMDPSLPEEIKRQFIVSIQPDGTMKAGALPSVLELDYVTRSLNDVAKSGDGKGALGGATNEGRLYGKLAREIRDTVKMAVPEYRTALEAASTEIGIQRARELGTTLLRPASTRREIAEAFDGMPQAERLAVKTSVREQIDDTIANTRRVLSRPGTETGEAVRALRDLSSRAAKDKLTFVLGEQEAAKLVQRLDEAGTAFEIAAALHQNSKTAVRQAVQGSIDESTAPSVVGKLLAGEPIQATKRLVQIFTGATPEARQAQQAGIYAEIARALTEARGAGAEQALLGINRVMQGQALTTAQANHLARQVATALAVGGYSGVQAVAR